VQAKAKEIPAYRNPDLPVDARVTDLRHKMTLAEKIARATM